MDAQNLSQRLETVAEFVPKGARVADIGSDHGYLPAALALRKRIAYAVAGEVVKGPYENAVREIQKLNLANIIQARLADGLAAIEDADQIDTITIAGMGGALITQILDAHPEKLTGVARLILQPNVGEARLRTWLMNHRFQIMAEKMIAEDGHTYEIIVAEPSIVPFRYSKYELTFGPFLLEKHSPVFDKKWHGELQRQKTVLQQMSHASQPPVKKIRQQEEYIALIKETLNNDDR
ncbi:tRNA (adenine(22)-N(1))-methyltransferase [Limosilactobacillus fastidiosus]|uniref:tRNA (Adenine-N(1))-methyltransferase n=1 Tax=Limosilactobacillus fastidiosus TaxID=2759855 RepID=A0A7W3YCU8_9LACO|nr:tRNA (adenine(22)-N(1))-methyltransferase TrmK [Limosilactobacillus fastidiosus]MBB1086491.1 tRNA (adenine-N(1))-methyltransferase [Limosilactobacillus fastidiosus]MCD7085157.1 tRNA (adenine(22)-N(1))-methyltransferase TrmK [Limosilactobacillus fastidiosus]MCD7115079.1 tRNA (adenine(22)-N(1))-methyltransferase TrmK [Limosilactobacillus fastidiosus]MCD7116237.1 tRNA (adenine(22)-N(1))-methyltransferase TrmK [Limosilactobacillus fastidiosus]